jgi:hypothetical protein
VVVQKKIVTLNPKDQNNTLIITRIRYGLSVSLLEGDGIPLALLYYIDETFASWVHRHIKTLRLANVASTTLTANTSLVVFPTLKQTTQYNNIAYEL